MFMKKVVLFSVVCSFLFFSCKKENGNNDIDNKIVYFEDYVPMDGFTIEAILLNDFSILNTNDYMINYMNTNTPSGISGGEIASGWNYQLSGDEYDAKYDDFRLISVVTPGGINYSKTSTIFSNNGLFKEGDIFSLSDQKYLSQFVKTNDDNNLALSNTDNKFLFNFKVLSLDKDNCKIAFFTN